MRKNTKSQKTAYKKYRKPFLLLIGTLILLTYPLNLVSKNISASLIPSETLQAKQILNVDYDYQLDIYDNINPKNPPFSEVLIKNIDEAQDSIYVAIYSFNLDNIRTALFLAALRGVDVHIIFDYEDKEWFEEFLMDGNAFFKVTYLGDTQDDEYYSHMHNKFIIIDPGTEREVLFTGPWNWSYFQQDNDPNILLQIKDSEIINSYLTEFNRLEKGKNGVNKLSDWDYTPWEKEITYPNGDKVEIWWSPGRLKNSIYSRIYELLENSEKTVDIGVALIGSKRIAQKILDKAEEGVKIRIIVDINQINKESSVIPWMQEQIKTENIPNIEIFEGGKPPTGPYNTYAIFHFQNMIVDNKVVLTGTANWTSGGFARNDENTLVFYSENAAGQFSKIFEDYLVYLAAQNID